MYNRIILIGRLVRDPELRYVPSGHPVANFTLAVDRPFKDSEGKREADFIDVVTWRKTAEQVSQYLTKGRMVAVEGRLQIRSYETQDGQKRKVAEVVADGVRFLDSKKASGNGAGSGHGVPEDAEEPGASAETPDETAKAGAGVEDDVPF